MNKSQIFCSILLIMSALGANAEVDFNRYAGTWYELARLPNTFQKDCAENITAQYTLSKPTEISVINSCIDADGQKKSARGTAWVPNTNDRSRLKVSFVPLLQHFHLFSGDYWIYALDPDYQWAIVGSPDKKYLWILSRQKPGLSTEFSHLKKRAKNLGFDVDSLTIASPLL